MSAAARVTLTSFGDPSSPQQRTAVPVGGSTLSLASSNSGSGTLSVASSASSLVVASSGNNHQSQSTSSFTAWLSPSTWFSSSSSSSSSNVPVSVPVSLATESVPTLTLSVSPSSATTTRSTPTTATSGSPLMPSPTTLALPVPLLDSSGRERTASAKERSLALVTPHRELRSPPLSASDASSSAGGDSPDVGARRRKAAKKGPKAQDVRVFTTLVKRLVTMQNTRPEDDDHSHWAPDSSVTECFECQAPFTTFRRRHHCRLCGQIFCGPCSATLVPGQVIGRGGILRVCAYCDKVIRDYIESNRISRNDIAVPVPLSKSLSTPRIEDDALTAAARRLLTSSQAVVSLPMSIVMRWNDPAVDAEANKILKTNVTNAPFRSTDGDVFAKQTVNYNSSIGVVRLSMAEREYVHVDGFGLAESSFTVEFLTEPTSTNANLSGIKRRQRPLLSFASPPFEAGGLLYEARDSVVVLETTAALAMETAGRPAAQQHPFPIPETPLSTKAGSISSQHADKRKSHHQQAIAIPSMITDASERHLKRLLTQVLNRLHLNVDKWGHTVLRFTYNVCSTVRPNIRNGDHIDVREYVRFKKLPGGSVSESKYIDGVVFTKYLAHKKMISKIMKPKVLIVDFPIEFHRQTNSLMSIEPLLMQERQYLRVLVNGIQALNPDVLVVQKSVSRLAQEYILNAGISLLLNVKKIVMEDVARATQTDVLKNVDVMSLAPRLGTCSKFFVTEYTVESTPVIVATPTDENNNTVAPPTYTIEKTEAVKSLVHFEGCSPNLFCTLLLRGGSEEELKCVKQALSFMFYAGYSMSLEAALFSDTFIKPAESIPEPAVVVLDASTDFGDDCDIKMLSLDLQQRIRAHRQSVLSVSPTVHFPLPYILSRRIANEVRNLRSRLPSPRSPVDALKASEGDHGGHGHEHEHDEDFQHKDEAAVAMLASDFSDATKRQALVILFTIFCVGLPQPCKFPQSLSINFYTTNDMSMGQYVEELCYNTREDCPTCTKPLISHLRTYVHHNGRITVSMEERACPVPGGADTILMWSVCRECSQVTPVCTMSEETYRYSVGKYLELSFYDTSSSGKLAHCGHSIFRDHVRYFALHNAVVTFEWEQIQRMEIVAPPTTLAFNEAMLEKERVDEVQKIEMTIFKFYTSIHTILSAIPTMPIKKGREDKLRATLELADERAFEEQEALLLKLSEIANQVSLYNLPDLNIVLKAAHERLFAWRQVLFEIARVFFVDTAPSNNPSGMAGSNTGSASIEPSPAPVRRPRSPTDPIGFPTSLRPASNTLPQQTNPNSHAPIAQPAPQVPLPQPVHRAPSPTDPLGFPVAAIHRPVVTNIASSSVKPVADPSGSTPVLTASASSSTQALASDILKLPPAFNVTETLLQHTPSPPAHMVRAITSGPVLQQQQHEDDSGVDSTAAAADHGDEPAAHPTRPQHRRVYSESAQRQTNRSPVPLEQQPPSTTPQQEEVADEKEATLNALLQSPTGPAWSLLRETALREPGSAVSSPMRSNARLSIVSGDDDEFSGHNGAAESPSKKRKPVPTPLRTLSRSDDDDEADEAQDRGEEEGDLDRPMLSPTTPRHHKSTLTSTMTVSEVVEGAIQSVHDDDGPKIGTDATSMFTSTTHSSGGAAGHSRSESETDASDASLVQHHSSSSATDIAISTSAVHPSSSGGGNSNSGAPIVVVTGTSGHGRQGFPRRPQDKDKDKGGIMKTIQSIFNVDSSSDGTVEPAQPELPPISLVFDPEEHVFAESLVIVNEDMPSSILAFCLSSFEYERNMESFVSAAVLQVNHSFGKTDDGANAAGGDSLLDLPTSPLLSIPPTASSSSATGGPTAPAKIVDEINIRNSSSLLEKMLLSKQEAHIKYQFFEGPTQFYCKVYFVQQFDALRQQCGVSNSFISSLSHCSRWDPKGGKSGSSFLQTRDGRYVIKQMSRAEMMAFLKFAPNYFAYMGRSLFQKSPTLLTKIFGVYQLAFKNNVTGKSLKQDVLVMENLFYDRKISRIFDLKGSLRSRYAQTTGQENDVLLDENLIEALHSSPLYIHEHSKRVLMTAIHSDTMFLADCSVIDYSLLVGLEQSTGELVVGIVDYIRTYTWDKKLESWVKETGLLGGGGKEPTIISPKLYKQRFREAMSRYFHVVADK